MAAKKPSTSGPKKRTRVVRAPPAANLPPETSAPPSDSIARSSPAPRAAHPPAASGAKTRAAPAPAEYDAAPATADAVHESASTPRSPRDRREPIDLGHALIDAFLTNERINQALLEIINPRVWRIHPPSTRGRNIATSFAHIHNVRCMRIKMSDKSVTPSEQLDRWTISIEEARWSLGTSARAMVALIEKSLASGGHVQDYRPDVVAMVIAAITHEAHHRGQICHWLRELGSPLTPEQQLTLWEWDKRWKEVRRR